MYEKILTFCEDVGISVRQFESICKLGNGYVGKLKKHTPGIKKAKRIAQVMGISLEELIGDE